MNFSCRGECKPRNLQNLFQCQPKTVMASNSHHWLETNRSGHVLKQSTKAPVTCDLLLQMGQVKCSKMLSHDPSTLQGMSQTCLSSFVINLFPFVFVGKWQRTKAPYRSLQAWGSIQCIAAEPPIVTAIPAMMSMINSLVSMMTPSTIGWCSWRLDHRSKSCMKTSMTRFISMIASR